MKKWLRKKSIATVGIDFGVDYVNLLELQKQDEQCWLVSYASFANVPDITQALQQALEQIKAKSYRIAIAIPHTTIINKTLQVDASLDEDEIEQFLIANSKQYTGYANEEINMDFSVLGEAPRDTAKTVVELVATKRDQVAEKTSLLEQLNYKATVVDVESFALQRAVLKNLANKKVVTAAIYLKSHVLLMSVFQDDLLLYATETQNDHAQTITQQIEQTLQMCFASHSITIEQIVLSGINADNPELTAEIKGQINIPVLPLDCFANIEIADAIDSDVLKQLAPQLLLSYGLALW
ncbi:MAG: pilus assembly protein PilM [Gammaproteobacteria bacterium]|nr:pilus assembly protein PilM [Gammaproteobacteria bacterium]